MPSAARLGRLVAHTRGDLETAREFGRISLQKHEALGDAHGTGLTLLNLGLWELESGDLEPAETALKRAIALFEKHNILLYHPIAQLHLGRVAEQRGDLQLAHEHYADGVRRARECENCEVEALGATLLGGVALILGNLSRARGFLTTALEVAKTIDEVELQALTLFGVAWVETMGGKNERCKKYTARLRELQTSAPSRNFYLRERGGRVVQAVRISRGDKQGDWYRTTALEVLRAVGGE